MPLIAVAQNRRMNDYVESIRRAGGETVEVVPGAETPEQILARVDDIVEQVVRTLEFAVLAKYGFGLAQLFNAFYHRAQILNEEREDVRRWRAAAVAYYRQQLTRVLDLMGVAVPARM